MKQLFSDTGVQETQDCNPRDKWGALDHPAFMPGGNFQTMGTGKRKSHEVHHLSWAGRNQSWEDKAAKVTKIRETENWKKNYPEKELQKSTWDLLCSSLNLHICNCLRPSEKLLLRKNNYQEVVNWMIPRAHTKQETFLAPTNQEQRPQKGNAVLWVGLT